MEQASLERTESASSVPGKVQLIHQIRDVQDVRKALTRLLHTPKLIQLLKSTMELADNDRGVGWLWGEQGLCLVSIQDTAMWGTFCNIEWFQNDTGKFNIKNDIIIPVVDAWCREHDISLIKAITKRDGPWNKVAGFEVTDVVITREVAECQDSSEAVPPKQTLTEV